MTDPGQRIALEILALVTPAIFVSRPDLFGIDTLLMTNLSLTSGNTPWSSHAYATYGFLLAMRRQDFPRAYALAEVGMALADRYSDPIQQCRTTHMAAFIQHFVRPIREAEALFRKGFQAGAESGELEWACFHAHFRAARVMFDGTNLMQAEAELERLRAFTVRAGNTHAVHLVDAVCFPLDFLLQSAPAGEIACEDLTETQQLETWANLGSHFAVFIYRVLRPMFCSCWAAAAKAWMKPCLLWTWLLMRPITPMLSLLTSCVP